MFNNSYEPIAIDCMDVNLVNSTIEIQFEDQTRKIPYQWDISDNGEIIVRPNYFSVDVIIGAADMKKMENMVKEGLKKSKEYMDYELRRTEGEER